MKLSADGHISKFLLVSLNIGVILQEPKITCKVQKLGAITDGPGLGDGNGMTLVQIKGQGREKARTGIP